MRPAKRVKLLEEDENDSSSNDGGVALDHNHSLSQDRPLKINEDYAKRFEHNNKRNEVQRRKRFGTTPRSYN